jgi:hypothetical protein
MGVVVRRARGAALSRLTVALAIAAMALALALGPLGSDTARGAPVVSDVTCNSVDHRMYFSLYGSDYDQWLWYRIWKFNPTTRQWDWYFDAPSFYLQTNWNQLGVIGGGGVGGSTRNGVLTYVTMSEQGWYYAAAFVAYSTAGTVVGYRYEWLTDYSNVDTVLRDRRACWTG